MLEIDTTISPYKYNEDFKKVYFKNKFFLRKKYSTLIDIISKKFRNNIDWWVSSVAERNLNSKLYHNLCLYFSLKELHKKKKIKKIIVGSNFLYEKVNDFYQNELILKKKNYSYVYTYLKIIIKHLIIFFFIKLFKKKKLFAKKINIVDKFITSTKLQNDRYYDNYFDNKDYIYVPTFVNLSTFEILKVIRNLNIKKNILKYNFLSLKDFFYSISFMFRIKKLFVKKIYFKGVNVTNLVNEEFLNFKNMNASIIGIQNFFLAKNLRLNNIKINKVINWFENSNVDKGWNFGFNKFFPKAKTFGYQGYFVEKEWLYIDPSKIENQFKVIPKKILCIGPNLIKTRKEFCKNLVVENDINLRFGNFDNTKKNNKKNNHVLITLNIDIDNSKSIIDKMLQTDYSKSGKKIFIKEHPLLKIKDLNISYLPRNVRLINGNFSDIVKKFKVVITSGSSSSILESFFSQCFIIFPFNNYFDKFNITELKIPQKRFIVCENIKQIDKYIDYFLNKKVKSKERIKAEKILGKNWNTKFSKYFN